jgi:hypothetical protein
MASRENRVSNHQLVQAFTENVQADMLYVLKLLHARNNYSLIFYTNKEKAIMKFYIDDGEAMHGPFESLREANNVALSMTDSEEYFDFSQSVQVLVANPDGSFSPVSDVDHFGVQST